MPEAFNPVRDPPESSKRSTPTLLRKTITCRKLLIKQRERERERETDRERERERERETERERERERERLTDSFNEYSHQGSTFVTRTTKDTATESDLVSH